MFFDSFRVSNNIFNHAPPLPPCLLHTLLHPYPTHFVSSFKKCLNPPSTVCAVHILCGIPLRSVQTTMGCILKETGLSLPQWLPTSLLHAGVLSVLSIHRSWAYCLLTMISDVQLPAVCRKHGFFVVIRCLRLLRSFLSPLPEPWEKDFGIDVPLRDEHSVVSYLLHPDQFGVFVFIYCQRMLF